MRNSGKKKLHFSIHGSGFDTDHYLFCVYSMPPAITLLARFRKYSLYPQQKSDILVG